MSDKASSNHDTNISFAVIHTRAKATGLIALLMERQMQMKGLHGSGILLFVNPCMIYIRLN